MVRLILQKTSVARLNEIAKRGTKVISFNLERTEHVFAKKQDGGLQQVIVKNESNSEQIKLIREHYYIKK
ncbi:MAG: hypothetical protein L3J75_14020 [Methylococcaceae bacterium]|nr:hypothetical protein [Methylococcaceae bacterium]